MWDPKNKKSARAKAEDLFNKAQKKEHALSDIENAKEAEREKAARLKAFRLAKSPT